MKKSQNHPWAAERLSLLCNYADGSILKEKIKTKKSVAKHIGMQQDAMLRWVDFYVFERIRGIEPQDNPNKIGNFPWG